MCVVTQYPDPFTSKNISSTQKKSFLLPLPCFGVMVCCRQFMDSGDVMMGDDGECEYRMLLLYSLCIVTKKRIK